MNVHCGGHPSQGHVHGVRHVWADEDGEHTTTFWHESEDELRAKFPDIYAQCAAAPKHKRVEVILDGVVQTPFVDRESEKRA